MKSCRTLGIMHVSCTQLLEVTHAFKTFRICSKIWMMLWGKLVIDCYLYSSKCLCLASEKFVLASGSNLSLATGLASWKVSLEPCLCLCANYCKHQRISRSIFPEIIVRTSDAPISLLCIRVRNTNRVHSESDQVLYTTALLQLNQVSICTMISSQ